MCPSLFGEGRVDVPFYLCVHLPPLPVTVPFTGVERAHGLSPQNTTAFVPLGGGGESRRKSRSFDIDGLEIECLVDEHLEPAHRRVKHGFLVLSFVAVGP